MAERVASLQRMMSQMETEKRDIERSQVRLEKDKSALKKTLDKVIIPNILYVRPKKINNMFLRHFFLENDAGGRLFIFIFFE